MFAVISPVISRQTKVDHCAVNGIQRIFELEFVFWSNSHDPIKNFFKQCFEYFPGDARKIEIILLSSKWQKFFKFDGKFDFREIFPKILRQAEFLGRLFVFLKSVTL